jgi:hypothetical protein
MQRGKVGLLLWMLPKSVGPSELELIRSCVDPLRRASLPRPTKGWPCETSGPEPFARSFSLLVDPGDICPPHLWLVVPKETMLLFMIGKLLVILIIIRVIFMLLIMIHMLCLPLALLLCTVEVGLGEIRLCLICLGKCAMNRLLFFMLATLLLFFHVRMQK